MSHDPYEVLGVSPTATDEVIRRRYLDLVRAHPPERDPERFAAVRAAYDKIKNPTARVQRRLFGDGSTESFADVVTLARNMNQRRMSADELIGLGRRVP